MTIYDRTGRALDGLEKLADTFAPLVSVRFSKQKRKSVLEDQIDDCLDLQERDLVSKGIKCSKPNTRTGVAVDPGELDAILTEPDFKCRLLAGPSAAGETGAKLHS